MHFAIIFNPLSGKGLAPTHADALHEHLRLNAHTTELHEVGPAAVKTDLDTALHAADATVVIGGDGTVHALAPLAAKHQTPVYHFPTGTENLFAREFGMSRRPADLDRAILTFTRRPPGAPLPAIDLPRCNKRPFLLMASLGSDANVVHRLAHNRTGRINHLSYIPHIANEIASPALPRYTIHADGKPVVTNKRGWAVIANARQYALRVDPAPDADPTDGLLDLVFCPAYTTASMVGWFLRARLRNHLRSPSVVTARAATITVESERPAHYQLDGEAPLHSAGDRTLGPASTPITIDIAPERLPVLTTRPLNTAAPAHRRDVMTADQADLAGDPASGARPGSTPAATPA